MGQVIILCITGITSLAIVCNYLEKRAWYKYGNNQNKYDIETKIDSEKVTKGVSIHK
ncbi:hypothetical protein ACQUEF_01720 [Vagococcus fluvialis]|uniref:hypothetical protein n=1 Tax=Vagococcus fluvialis TaxID=2738 RepID=UPI003D14D923